MSDNESLIWNIKNGDLDVVSKHVDANPKAVNDLVKGRSYLHYACDYGQLEIIDFLLSKGANVNLQDKYNLTPLLAACFENHESCVKLLLRKGADRTVKSPDGTPLVECTDNESIKAMLR